MIIAVTGTPGTGKTRYAKALARKLGYAYIDGNQIAKQHGLTEGYDRPMKCYIIDPKKLSRAILMHLDGLKGAVVDSHMSHYLPHSKVKECIVMRCKLSTLKRRLEKRGYSKAKVRENLDSEIFEVCLTEALDMGHEVRQVFS